MLLCTTAWEKCHIKIIKTNKLSDMLRINLPLKQ